MFILDTNVVSELRKAGSGKADPNVVQWLGQVDAPLLFLSVVTILELELGVRRLERRDQSQGRLLRAWLDRAVLPEFKGRVLPIDIPVALRCAELNVPDPKPERDALIAASALVHGMTIVTRNIADFAPMGVATINPWDRSA